MCLSLCTYILRLVSAYQDKLVDQADKFYKRVVDHIVHKYGAVTFKNFVEMILSKARRHCRQMKDCRLDKHWRPFISRCGYCNVPYKVIAKAENFAQDQKFIGRLADVDFKPISKVAVDKLYLTEAENFREKQE